MRNHTRAHRRSHRRGILAEHMALIWLMLKGYWPVAMRYKTPVGEVDLIMRRGNILTFVEVKGRRHILDAAQAIHTKNQTRVVRASQHFLMAHPSYANFQVRFDALLIAWYARPQHVVNAFGG